MTSGSAWAVLDERARELRGATGGGRRDPQGAEGGARGGTRGRARARRARGGRGQRHRPAGRRPRRRRSSSSCPTATSRSTRPRRSSSARGRTARCTSSRTSTPSVAERVSASDVLREAAAIVGRRRRRPSDDGPRRREGSREAPGRTRGGGAPHRRGPVRVLALDYGAARTGVAVSDATGTIARPRRGRRTGGHERRPGARLATLVREHEAERVVVGMPLTLRGERGRAGARDASAFVEALRGVVSRSGRDVRRAVHDRARGRRRAARRRGRTRSRAPPRELPATAQEASR